MNPKQKRFLAVGLLTAACGLFPFKGSAQLSSNPDKFLGNITTRYSVDYGSEKFYTLWNQITPENETKWDAIEGNGRGNFTFGNADRAANYAKQHGFPFKYHTLIWGAQYPRWMDNLSTAEQTKAIVEYFDAVKKHYPNLEIIDVVNEAITGHQPAPYRAALGGEGKTGYDWIIKAFEMAHERWPDAILVYNDYNTFQWQKTQFIDLVRTLRDAGAPVDAYGCQSHDLTDMSLSSFKSAMTEIQNALKMPMYSTEFDIGTSDDQKQLTQYKNLMPYLWEADYCAGVTLWGYIYGATWTTDGNSGLIRDGKDRPAMTWLREYMKTDEAKNAKSPFPEFKKEASVYVKASELNVTKGDAVPIEVSARLRTKTIDHIDLYVKNKYLCTLTEEPYTATYTTEEAGRYDVKAVVTATDSSKYERWSGFTAHNPRRAFKGGTDLPGTLQAEDFDMGAEGIAFHDSNSENEGVNTYRSEDSGGVDIVSGNGNYAIGYTVNGEWLEYTVNVKEAGLYEYNAYISSQDGGGQISLAQHTDDGLTDLTGSIPLPRTGNWNTYKIVHGRLNAELAEGTQILRLNIEKGNFNIDKINFKRIEVDPDIEISLTAEPATGTIGEETTLNVEASSAKSDITSVKFYVDNVIIRNITQAPFVTTYKPTAKGTYLITAFATDAEGRQSKMVDYTLKVTPKRTPFNSIVALPGIIQAEDFDKGGEGFTFHDSDSQDEGGTNYRSDNEGLDIVSGNGSYALGYTAVNEWTEYTVDVTDPGKYAYEATVSSGVTGSSFTIGLVNDDGKVTSLAKVNVPQTGSSNWDTYRVVKGNLSQKLAAGQQILRFTITGQQCNIDKVEFKCTVSDGIENISADNLTDGPAYNLAGQKVSNNYKGIVVRKGKKVKK